MKRKALTWLVLVAGLLGPSISLGQQDYPAPQMGWTALGPPGGDVAAMAFVPGSPGKIHVLTGGVPGQLFTTSNGGADWTRTSILSDQGHGLAVDPGNPDTLYVLHAGVVAKSTDGGATWTSSPLGNDRSGAEGGIAVHPFDPSTVYAAGSYVYDAGSRKTCVAFFRSSDAGASWALVPINPSVPLGTGYCLAVDPADPNKIFIGGVEAEFTGQGTRYRTVIYGSSDGGATWSVRMAETLSSTEAPVECLALDPSNPTRLYAGTQWNVYRSQDGGLSWQSNSGQAFAHALAVDPVNPMVVYAGWDDAVYRSADGGVSWLRTGVGLGGVCRCLLAAPGQTFYGSDEGLYKSADGGTTWQESHMGLFAAVVNSVAVSASSPNVVYTVSQGFVWKSVDHGEDWIRNRHIDPLPHEGVTKILVHPRNPDLVYAVSRDCYG